jgi:hypothetical protein
MLGGLLVMPFGVYHSISEPYIVGSLWGYQLPIGYVGVLLGILAVLYPKLGKLKTLRFSSFMIVIGVSLLSSFALIPSDYFINLLHGTSFSPSQIDVDFALGNSAVLGLALLSIVFGLVSFIRGWLPQAPSLPDNQKSKAVSVSQTTEGGLQKNFFKISLVADAVIMNLFLLAHLLVDPFNQNLGYAAVSWSIFLGALISANFLLYRYSKRKTNRQMEKSQ